MKLNTLTMSALALAGLALVGSTAQAVSYNTGDLFLGFRATGGTGANTNYLINIGSASQFRDATSSFTLSISGIDADLTAIFGAWENRSDLLWSVIGGPSTTGLISDQANTIYASKAETVLGTPETAWARLSNSTQAGIATKIGDNAGTAGPAAGGYLNAPTTYNALPLSNAAAVAEDQGAANPWAKYQYGFGTPVANTTAFGQYGAPGIEGSFGNGTAGAALDLFRMVRSGLDDGTGNTTGNGTYEGTFKINDNGQVSFNVVPEPSSLAILSMGASLLGVFRLRRQKNAA
jgi:hypothetical protein